MDSRAYGDNVGYSVNSAGGNVVYFITATLENSLFALPATP